MYYDFDYDIQDHPRVCGEQKTSFRASSRGAGSPPRVRGTVLILLLGVKGLGITPACAGNSSQYLQIRSML